jgi:hypothetical protein
MAVPANAPSPILTKDEDASITTDDNDEHCENAESPIVTTDAGILKDVRAEHPLNAVAPMFETEEGVANVTEDRDV